VRAFCHLDQRFKDFLLSRCISADGDEAQEASGISDKNWHEFFSVVLMPNPLLSVNQREIVAQDYCMEDGKIAISIRRSFLYYFRKRLRLDVAQALDNVGETPVVVENQKEFEAALIEADR
jgi:predicted DNA-binding transcriptional regulator YafY